MLILKQNIQYRLWFDVDLRLVTTALVGCSVKRLLWFDVDLRQAVCFCCRQCKNDTWQGNPSAIFDVANQYFFTAETASDAPFRKDIRLCCICRRRSS